MNCIVNEFKFVGKSVLATIGTISLAIPPIIIGAAVSKLLVDFHIVDSTHLKPLMKYLMTAGSVITGVTVPLKPISAMWDWALHNSPNPK